MQIDEFIFVPIDYISYIVGLIFILISFFIFLFTMKKIPKDNIQKNARQNLKNLKSLNDPKQIAYSFCQNAQIILNEKNKNLYQEIANELEIFKYRKNTDDNLNKELEAKIKRFVEDFV